ncbi:hypothetical protein OG210_21810 [Streptomyces sp. NBC_00466]|uniref:hypothetical protein n=1 Tax=Streptomyces sp. NBC_00466 TaxID=2903655 RepID=UPI0030E0D412
MDLHRVFAMAQEADSGPDIGSLLGKFVQYGVVGLIVVLLILGVIAPKYVLDALSRERDNWRDAFEKEREAHQVTLQQLAAAQASADVANEQGRAMVKLLEEFGHRPQSISGSA